MSLVGCPIRFLIRFRKPTVGRCALEWVAASKTNEIWKSGGSAPGIEPS
jgi:hypothetical protein